MNESDGLKEGSVLRYKGWTCTDEPIIRADWIPWYCPAGIIKQKINEMCVEETAEEILEQIRERNRKIKSSAAAPKQAVATKQDEKQKAFKRFDDSMDVIKTRNNPHTNN